MGRNILTKYGLTGNSGLGVANMSVFHVSANYYAGKNKVFIEKIYKEWGLIWERMTLYMARKKKKKIITCAKCLRPAISLDHHWPYYDDHNYCELHHPKK